MKKLIFLAAFSMFLVLVSINASGHEEPAKTRLEKKEKQKEAKRISKQCLKSSLAYKQKVSSRHETAEKYLYLKTDYNCRGFMDSISLFDSTGKIDTKVIYSYDCQQNMILDADYDSDGKLIEKIEYYYFEDGRLKGATGYDGEKADSRFEYRLDKPGKLVEFTKFIGADSIEYKIDYRYKGNPDKSGITEIYKYIPAKDTLMSVKYVLSSSGKVNEKQIFGNDHKMMYKFKYQYDKKGNRSEISKIMPDGSIGFIQKFEYDCRQNMLLQNISYPADGTEVKITYEYLF